MVKRAVRGEGPIPLGGELGVELPELREERDAVATKYVAQRERRECARAAWHSPSRRAWRSAVLALRPLHTHSAS